jgi:hypothetical protein
VPEGKDPERVCDIELRFVFALERDVARLIARARRRVNKSDPERMPKDGADANAMRGDHSAAWYGVMDACPVAGHQERRPTALGRGETNAMLLY